MTNLALWLMGTDTHRAVPPEVADDAGEDGAAALHRGEVPAALARLRVVRDVLEVGPARPARPDTAAPAAATVEEAVVALLLPVGLVPAVLLLLRTCNAERRQDLVNESPTVSSR